MHVNELLISAHAQTIREKLAPLLPKGTDYALIDFPDHSNVGDSAIWLGAIKLLEEITGRRPTYTCTPANFSSINLRAHHPHGPILINGGGNLGDIYAHHQGLRMNVIQEFKDRTIIQLPQSIQFNDMANAKAFGTAARKHGNVHIFTRDTRSQALAQDLVGADVELAPDCAFGMGPLARPAAAIRDVFCLLRSDTEKTELDYSIFQTTPNLLIDDWLIEPELYKKSPKIRAIPSVIASGQLNRQSWRNRRSDYSAKRRLGRGMNMLAQGQVVITDRLHAHILSVLMGIPNIVLDNSYGKIHGYMDAWTAGAHKTVKAKTPEEAFELLRDMQRHD